MATQSALTVFRESTATLRIDVKTEDGGATPQTMTGWTLSFRIERQDGQSVCSIVPTIGNGDGTDDRATVAIGVTDIAVREGREYRWALWRVDGSNDVVLAYGPCVIVRTAAQ